MTDAGARTVEACRICGSADLHGFLDLGSMPLANGFVAERELGMPERHYPLRVSICEDCSLAQLMHVVSPELLYSSYLYRPSVSSTMTAHFSRLAADLVARYALDPGDLVVDIGSNDGTLLTSFRKLGLSVLGVDPAKNLEPLAARRGVHTLSTWFTASLANEIARSGRPRLVVATNVMAHVDDLHDFCEGVRLLLGDDGVFVAEFPYLTELIQKTAFDTIYHEHLSYLSLRPLVHLFARHGLVIFDAEEVSVHGGSLRIHIGSEKAARMVSERPSMFLVAEGRLLSGRDTYAAFAERSRQNRMRLVEVLESERAAGRRIVGYGAAAKGNVLLNACGLRPPLVEYVVDSTPEKHGRYTPGTRLRIFPEDKLEHDRPDTVLVLAWNFLEEILEKQGRFRAQGGRFVLAVPEVRLFT